VDLALREFCLFSFRVPIQSLYFVKSITIATEVMRFPVALVLVARYVSEQSLSQRTHLQCPKPFRFHMLTIKSADLFQWHTRNRPPVRPFPPMPARHHSIPAALTSVQRLKSPSSSAKPPSQHFSLHALHVLRRQVLQLHCQLRQ
jgi:hypothetical protein